MDHKKREKLISTGLKLATFLNALALLLVAWVYREVVWGVALLTVTQLGLFAFGAYRNQVQLRAAVGARSTKYGLNAVLTTLLVIGIIVVLNFLSFNHGWKKDLTRSGVNTLSDQTTKILKELKADVKVTAFVKAQGREQAKDLLENYRYHTDKIKYEFVDPDKEPGRTNAANVKKYNTVIFESGGKETRTEDLTEEKFTNALIKLVQSKTVTMCFLTGHGERAIDGSSAEGYSYIAKEMGVSSWVTQSVNLLQEAAVPANCTVLIVLGPTKAFFDKEIDAIGQWLDNGGRALFALDPDIQRGEDRNAQINKLLAKWFVRVRHEIVIDPLSKLLGAEASVPIVATYNKEHVVTKDFQATTLFPIASSVESLPSPPATLKVKWLAKSTPKSFAETDFKGLGKGQAKFDSGNDRMGPLDMVVAVEGKREASAKADARIIVMGSSAMASNGYARHAQNMDLFLNSASWLADDESLISIRPKEDSAQPITLSQTEGRFIQLLTMVLVPLFSIGTGVTTYIRRRKL
jgi:ABC-type uncharacterized transport system involved in gliding motility auxiliary subunit